MPQEAVVFSKYSKTVSIREKIPDMPIDRLERLNKVFSNLAIGVFGKSTKASFKVSRTSSIGRFIVTLEEDIYDYEFIGIIVLNIADASIRMSLFKKMPSVLDDSLREAKMCFSLYMNRQKDEMKRIKKEYVEVFRK